MHIVYANQWYPPESGWGGVASYNYYVTRALYSMGHQVTVITARLSSDVPANQMVDGIRVQRLLIRDAYRWRQLPGIGHYARPVQQLAYSRRVDAALRRLHREQPVDVVEFAEVNAEGFFYARQPEIPVVVRCHTPTFILKRYYARSEMPFDTRIIGACEKDTIRRAHALTAPSSDMAKVIAAEVGVPLERITVIPNPLASDDFFNLPAASEENGTVTILHVGRMERVKGVRVLADAIPQIAEQVPAARFVFIGEDRPGPNGGSQCAELQAQFARAGIGERVEFVTAVDHAQLLEWYRRADICTVPSMLYESFSYTCAQAMAAGKPIVASRIGGIPETVDDSANGIIVTPGSVEELSEAIILLCRDAGLRRKMGQAGRDKATHEFGAHKIAQQTLQVYVQAQRRHSSG